MVKTMLFGQVSRSPFAKDARYGQDGTGALDTRYKPEPVQ